MRNDFSQPETLWLYGVIAACLGTMAFLPYLRDTLAGRTQPQRASWLIWAVLSFVALASQFWEGATTSLWFAAAKVSGTVLICIIAIWKGTGGYWDRRDSWVLALAGLGLVLWAMTETAVYALAISITISFLGGTITIAKAFADPDSETISMWLVSFVAACFAIAAVGGFDPVLMAYPAYLFVLNAAILLAMLAGRARRTLRASAFVARQRVL